MRKPQRAQRKNTHRGKRVILVCSLLLSLNQVFSQAEKLRIGMNQKEFNAVMENLIPGENNFNGYIRDNIKLNNLPFQMHGEIKNDTLVNIWASSTGNIDAEESSQEKDKKTLENYIFGVNSLFSSFKKLYGDATPGIDKTQSFTFSQNTRSDTIFRCAWQNSTTTAMLTLLYKSSSREPNAYQFDPLPNANASAASNHLRLYFTIRGKESKENVTGLACGMNAATVYKTKKELMPNGYFTTGTWRSNGNIYGIENDWVFEFENGKLVKYSFDHQLYDSDMYSEENTLTDQKYTKCMMSAKSLVNEYKKLYGMPVSGENGPGSLKEARKKMEEVFKKTYGDEKINIVSATWKNEKQEISVSLIYRKRVSKDTMVTLEYEVVVK